MSQTQRYDARQRPPQGWEREPAGFGAGDPRMEQDRQHTRERKTGGGPRTGGSARTSRGPGRRRAPARQSWWGRLDALPGIGIVAGCGALGAISTVIAGREPGALLGAFILAGTVAAGLAVRPGASYLIIPVPALAYFVAAMAAGYVVDHAGSASRAMLAVGAVQWIAAGFIAMVAATVAAVGIAVTRWWLAMRRRLAGRLAIALRANAGFAGHAGVADALRSD